jgi:hypothetical protein
MIEAVLLKSSIAATLVTRHATLFSELPGSDREIATCPVLQFDDVRIYWKSSHGSHTGDKTKELCGRGFALRNRRTRDGEIVPFTDVRHTVLVLDGDFDGSEVEHLIRTGWDAVISSRDVASLPELLSGRSLRAGE